MPKRITPEKDLLDQGVIRHIDEFGWHVMFVGESDRLPGWSYSIGLYDTFRHPEIIMFGLPNDVMHRAIHNLGEKIRSGKMYDAGFEYDEPFDGLMCLFHLVNKNWYPIFVGRATRLYEGEDFPILQCICPDKNKNYPWSPKFDRGLITKQPWLFRSDFRDARAKGYLRDYFNNEPLDPLVRAVESSDSTVTSICSKHQFRPEAWPFEQPKKLVVYADGSSVTGAVSVIGAFHERDGTWLLLTTEGNEPIEPREVCFGCVYTVDPSVADIADLPRGWGAFRRKPGEIWERKPQDEE
jgi:hypothetical protein